MKKSIKITIITLALLAGFAILFYPDISNWHNSRVHADLILNHNEELALLREEYVQEHFRRARDFNDMISGLYISDPFVPNSGIVLPPSPDYMEILYVNGMMGQIEIPSINVNLPVFHSTSHATLLRGVGHLEHTSFPVGGETSHSVLTAHSGLASHRLFTDLEELGIGELFFVRILGETFAYQVDQRRVVLPHEIQDIALVPGEDLLTLITCTPYAINSHRLLVRGVRVPYEPGIVETILTVLPETFFIDFRLITIAAMLSVFAVVLVTNKLRVNTVRRNIVRRRLIQEWIDDIYEPCG